MKTHTLFALSAVTLVGCGYLQSLTGHRSAVDEDPSVRFPPFFERAPTEVGATGEPYQLNGEVLRALSIAQEDYLPPSTDDTPCPSRREAQLYRVIQQQGIVFISIHENHTYCGRQYPVRHSGARYAISAEGRILRRLIGDQPESPREISDTDGGVGREAAPGVSPLFDALD